MSEPPVQQPKTGRFLAELAVVAVAGFLLVRYAVHRRAESDAPPPAMEPGERAPAVAAPERARLSPAQPLRSISIAADAPAPPAGDAELEAPAQGEKAPLRPHLKGKKRYGQADFRKTLPPEKQGPPPDPAHAEPGSAADPASQTAEERQLKPVILERPAIDPDSPALARERPQEEEPESYWNWRTIVVGVGAAFLFVFLLLARALRRGPGGDGLSLD